LLPKKGKGEVFIRSKLLAFLVNDLVANFRFFVCLILLGS